MNKKIVRVMLLGVLTLTTATSIVGCKDYDSDISGLQEQVDQVKKDLSELKTSVGDYVKSIAYDAATGTLTATKGNGESVSIKVQQNLPVYTVEIVGNKVVLKADGVEVSSATLPASPTAPDAFDPTKLTIVDGVIFYDGTKTGATLPTTSGSITEIKNGETLIGYTIVVNGQTASFDVIDSVPLKGMVFEPQAYLNGIAAMKAANLQYNQWSALAYEKPSLVGETWKTNGAASYITPKVVAYYNLNPSSATKAQITKASFKFDDKIFIGTRAVEFNPTVDKMEDETVNGQPMLKVTLNVAAEFIQAIDADKVSVLALQATINVDGKGEKVITSDYAAIYKSIMTDFRLACNKVDVAPHHMHLYGATDAASLLGQAKEAIDEAPTYEVLIGGTPLDLKKVVETHYNEWTDAAVGNRKALVTDGTLENITDLGLAYKFSQSNYITGSNETPQNEFFTLVDGVVTPKVYGTEGSAAAGRMPLVRVELIDVATGNTVNAGWIKIEIKKEGVGSLEEVCSFPNFELACGTKDNEVSVEFMNVKIYNALGLSKKEFHELYTLKTLNGNAVLATGDKGVVTEKIDTDPLNETNVLVWTLNQETDVYPSTSDDFTATVTYEPKDASTRKDVVITLKAKVTRPSGSISDANKINEYWDATKTFVRLNVETPKAGANCNFVTNLDNAFVGNKIVVSNVPEQYESFASDLLTYKYIFAAKNNNREVLGNDGKKYILSVSTDGFTLYAGGVANVVATINNATHEVTYNENSAVAKALLNIEAHDANPFFAYINVVVTNGCDMKLPLTNEIFEAKFLRPVNLFKNKDGKFIDGQDNGSTVNLLDLVYLTDWRDAKFSENKSYYTYYDIMSIEMDSNKKVTSSLNGDNFQTPLDQITKEITLVAAYKQDKVTPDYGTITYHNNGNAVGAFQLKIPVVVTYKWGTVTTDIIVDVEKTIGN